MPQGVLSSYRSHLGIGNMFASRLYGVLFHMLVDFCTNTLLLMLFAGKISNKKARIYTRNSMKIRKITLEDIDFDKDICMI